MDSPHELASWIVPFYESRPEFLYKMRTCIAARGFEEDSAEEIRFSMEYFKKEVFPRIEDYVNFPSERNRIIDASYKMKRIFEETSEEIDYALNDKPSTRKIIKPVYKKSSKFKARKS
uniref:Uncharacterized protein n=1 Tax=Clastoptera arizonana TaxID=38151 RepID=A0A1B6E3L1_9HEMI